MFTELWEAIKKKIKGKKKGKKESDIPGPIIGWLMRQGIIGGKKGKKGYKKPKMNKGKTSTKGKQFYSKPKFGRGKKEK